MSAERAIDQRENCLLARGRTFLRALRLESVRPNRAIFFWTTTLLSNSRGFLNRVPNRANETFKKKKKRILVEQCLWILINFFFTILLVDRYTEMYFFVFQDRVINVERYKVTVFASLCICHAFLLALSGNVCQTVGRSTRKWRKCK